MSSSAPRWPRDRPVRMNAGGRLGCGLCAGRSRLIGGAGFWPYSIITRVVFTSFTAQIILCTLLQIIGMCYASHSLAPIMYHFHCCTSPISCTEICIQLRDSVVLFSAHVIASFRAGFHRDFADSNLH